MTATVGGKICDLCMSRSSYFLRVIYSVSKVFRCVRGNIRYRNTSVTSGIKGLECDSGAAKRKRKKVEEYSEITEWSTIQTLQTIKCSNIFIVVNVGTVVGHRGQGPPNVSSHMAAKSPSPTHPSMTAPRVETLMY